MIYVSENITLQSIQVTDHAALYKLMSHIFPQHYDRFWKDKCSWYLNTFYCIDMLKEELQEKGNAYYFVCFRRSEAASYKRIGILRTISDLTYPPLPKYKAYKLHRIYLDSTTHGLGIGKKITSFIEEKAKTSGHHLVWLNAMDKQTQAQAFYKRLNYEKSVLQELDFDLLHEDYKPMWYLHKLL